jgi:hypothetical protein
MGPDAGTSPLEDKRVVSLTARDTSIERNLNNADSVPANRCADGLSAAHRMSRSGSRHRREAQEWLPQAALLRATVKDIASQAYQNFTVGFASVIAFAFN